MIDKYLRRFCAQEIQILIKKLEDDYGAFTEYHSAWLRLLEAKRYMTGVEKYCVGKAYTRAAKGYDRQQYLAAILKQQLSPMTREELEDQRPMDKAAQMNLQRQYASQIAQMQSHMQNQMMNAAAQQGFYK